MNQLVLIVDIAVVAMHRSCFVALPGPVGRSSENIIATLLVTCTTSVYRVVPSSV